MDFELGIIGAGPAGYSAGIYAGRAGIKSAIFDKGMGGGLAAVSPNIENYAGFEEISGFELTEKMKKHAEKYSKLILGEEVADLKQTDKGWMTVCDYRAKEDSAGLSIYQDVYYINKGIVSK